MSARTVPTAPSRRQRACRIAELARLRVHVERRVAKLGGFRGPVRGAQRRWSIELDRIEAAFQAAWIAA